MLAFLAWLATCIVALMLVVAVTGETGNEFELLSLNTNTIHDEFSKANVGDKVIVQSNDCFYKGTVVDPQKKLVSSTNIPDEVYF